MSDTPKLLAECQAMLIQNEKQLAELRDLHAELIQVNYRLHSILSKTPEGREVIADHQAGRR